MCEERGEDSVGMEISAPLNHANSHDVSLFDLTPDIIGVVSKYLHINKMTNLMGLMNDCVTLDDCSRKAYIDAVRETRTTALQHDDE